LGDQKFRASIVWLIANGKAEEALELLAGNYGVDVPEVRVGLPKGHRTKTLGCYVAKDKTITVLNSDVLKEPFVILHEFYHHIRTGVEGKHRGTERHADDFAGEFIEAYKAATGQ
jgi:hypothetical protein